MVDLVIGRTSIVLPHHLLLTLHTDTYNQNQTENYNLSLHVLLLSLQDLIFFLSWSLNYDMIVTDCIANLASFNLSYISTENLCSLKQLILIKIQNQ